MHQHHNLYDEAIFIIFLPALVYLVRNISFIIANIDGSRVYDAIGLPFVAVHVVLSWKLENQSAAAE
jgi:hypothetical protein